MSQEIIEVSPEQIQQFEQEINNLYQKQIEGFFGNKDDAMKFCSSLVASIQRTPKLLQCERKSLFNAFMQVAQLRLMPSNVSGEAWVIPYANKGNLEAQFQLGYQGLVTLFYRAGGQSFRAEIVREHDVFSYENGVVKHTVDIFKSKQERGKAIGAYVIATMNGQEIGKAMNRTDILAFGAKYSKSFDSQYSPWKEENDPELTMWKKTVLKQLAKLLPKNETINQALAYDNEDSIMADRIREAKQAIPKLQMGHVAASSVEPAPVEYVDVPDDFTDPEPAPVYKPKPAFTPAASTGKGGTPGVAKNCPVCFNEHDGPYPKCLNCWKKENPR